LFHEAGATAVEELGFALALGAEYLAELETEPVFSFAVSSNYFIEIAKLRAARRLWSQILTAFNKSGSATIFVRTSLRNMTVYDPHVNLLRTTTESMSAVIGGADALYVEPFDRPYAKPNEFSRHLALNTQLILRDEAYLGKVSDPAAGSWYIESLTDSVAQAAWKLFQEIEAMGGMSKAFSSGFVAKTVATSRDKRAAAVNSRRKTLLGTNQYPNLKERMLDQIEQGPLANRLADPFEKIRLRTERHAAESGWTPKVLLVPMGDLKMRRARADFIANFFGCAGFEIQEPPAFTSSGDATAAILQNKPNLAVLCSSDPEYPAFAAEVCSNLKTAGSDVPVLVAGFPKDAVEALKASGVTDFVHIKSNPIETLASWQQKLGVRE
jgi:methylmalonyl-CoA mutase